MIIVKPMQWQLMQLVILISSLGSAIILPHFSHFEVSNGSYKGIITLTLGSGEGCSRKILLTETLSNDHNCISFLGLCLLSLSSLPTSWYT